jgi:hypothetical protein
MIRTKCVSGSTSAIRLRGARHAVEREHEAEKQDLRQEREERDLERLDLRRGDGRDQETQRERGGDEHDAAAYTSTSEAADRHVEEQPSRRAGSASSAPVPIAM